MRYQVLLLLKATPKWLALSKTYRERIFTDVVYPLFLTFTDVLQIQVFSSQAFHATVSDVVKIETESMEIYYKFLEQLKSSRMFSESYFELHDIIVGAENGFRKFNEQAKKEGAVLMN
ncbi:MAG: darcynin family protein [Panacibacter sp.]